jgi:hypothetical protein
MRRILHISAKPFTLASINAVYPYCYNNNKTLSTYDYILLQIKYPISLVYICSPVEEKVAQLLVTLLTGNMKWCPSLL